MRGHVLAQHLQQLVANDGVKAGRGLVQYQQVRTRGKTCRKLQLHALPAREVAYAQPRRDRPVRAFGLVHDVHAVEKSLERGAIERRVRKRVHGRYLANREVAGIRAHGRDRGRTHARPSVRLLPRRSHVLSKQHNRAPVRPRRAKCQAHERRLSGTVSSHESHDRAAGNRKADIPHGKVVKAFCNVAQPQRRGFAGRLHGAVRTPHGHLAFLRYRVHRSSSSSRSSISCSSSFPMPARRASSTAFASDASTCRRRSSRSSSRLSPAT